MNIFNKVALQGLKKNRTRTIVTIVGVVLSAAMFTAVATFGVSLLSYMTDGAVMKYGGWHVAFPDADAAFVQEQKLNKEVVCTVTFENIGYAALEGGNDPNKPYFFIAGFDQAAFDALPIALLSGRLPENSGEILISGRLVSGGGISCAQGDTLTLAVGDRVNGARKLGQGDPYAAGTETFLPRDERTYTVVGICQTPAFEEDSAPGYTLITRTDAAGTAGSEAGLSLFVTLKNPRRIRSYMEAAEGHAAITNHRVLRFMGYSDEFSDRIFNTLLYSVGGIVIVIIMIGSIFLIYNSFSISLNERTRQIGILSSVGATAKQLRSSVLFEGLCIGAVGIPIGLLLGLGGIWLVISGVAGNFGNVLYEGVPLTMKISVPAMAGAAAVSMVTILISAYIPAKKAAGTPVMECIRQTNEVKVAPKALKTSKLAHRLYGLEGILALKNFKRNKKRYRSIVLSLVLSIVLFVSTSAFVSDLKQASEQAKVVTSYDIALGLQDAEDAEMLRLYDRLKETQDVTDCSYQVIMKFRCAVSADLLTEEYWDAIGGRTSGETAALPVNIQFFDDNTFLKFVRELGLPEAEYTGENGKLIAAAKVEDSQAEGVEQLPDVFQEPSVNMSFIPEADGARDTAQGQNINVTIVEITPPDATPTLGKFDKQAIFFQVMAPWSMKEKLAPGDFSEAVKSKGLTFQSDNPSQSTAGIKTAFQEDGTASSYILLNTSEAFEESRNYIFIANVFAYTFIVMISLIAAANVFNTISTNIKLRRQELAMLRSVGMSDRDFNRMMRFECLFYGFRALLIGLPLAAVFSWLIYKGMFAGGAEELHFSLPWASIGVSVFSVLLVIFVTMMYAVSKIKKENIIDALRDDMT